MARLPWLPLYMDEKDAAAFLAELNTDSECAFIVSAGAWVACTRLEHLVDGRYCLWHVPSGPLPLLRARGEPVGTVEDPWVGWNEVRSGADRSQPYFGSGHVGIIWWDVRTVSRRIPGGIGLSSFGWIGNHYRVLGRAAAPSTESWWAGLRKKLRRWKARRIPRSGPPDGPRPEVWAMPSALARIQSGAPRDNNPS